MTEQERKARKKIKKILNNYVTQWDGLDGYQLCVSELEKLTTKVSSVEMPVKPANGDIIKIIDDMLVNDRKVFNEIDTAYKNKKLKEHRRLHWGGKIQALNELKSRLSV